MTEREALFADLRKDLDVALQVVDYVVSSHEWCSQPHKCKCCGSHLGGACSQHPKLPKCEGCKARDDAIAILERHGLV